MIVDDAGALWLSNPWIALMTLTVAVGLVVWCHRWLETGKAPTPRSLTTAGRARLRAGRPQALRTNRVGSLSADAPLIHFSRGTRPSLRTRRPAGQPRSAA